MLTKEDKIEIREIVSEEVDLRTNPLRRSLVEIEKDRKILKDIWEFIKDHATKINDHEERISNLESPQKF
ncbi:hypothetical protein A3J17_02315 [Candidatus Curtissbacteria bacterium RIFCSPLOWO2_02_FULL_40_11]|uniref:Uncharacterized protein n=2 Tax=Candidatus Curtissiibacteriota TaxID=1752717 RepID=A0A1F5G9A6_9BACT|nr:MAG: hypothetical protein A3D04_00890 [Candidatus Curtissbacteria bacterium RIFCSPHIGHO2_02_FULL_40_16b]OGD99602.1 MAG: hypothetical protein A3J17_02315 [Candidatus Curtissbacteria bacterium RIFCSPLOWO2_02_FULL_40_11]OGE14121.1 MAG: hypothetical protein A3G14_01505 [Candidatus Curtissbacteria bacterium RIFCSPLOWO2_12_FULL_38_9]